MFSEQGAKGGQKREENLKAIGLVASHDRIERFHVDIFWRTTIFGNSEVRNTLEDGLPRACTFNLSGSISLYQPLAKFFQSFFPNDRRCLRIIVVEEVRSFFAELVNLCACSLMT